MITQSQSGIVKPINHLSLHTSSISPIPKNPSHVLKDPNWHNVMYDKYNVLVKNGTWLLVPRLAGVNMVHSMWLFKHKFHVDWTLSRYKARLVANGSSQQLGVNFDETFSPIIKPVTIRTVTYLLLYVDDIILMASSIVLLQHLIDSLHREFDMTDLGLLERAHMVNYNPSRTPVDIESKLVLDGVPVQDPTLYRSLAGGLQYLMFTRTLDLGLHLYASSTTSLVGYTDADWAGCPSTRMSTLGYCVFLGDNLLSWSAKRQHTLSRSSAKDEYWGVANVVAETAWLRNLLCELHSPLSTATLVYCDNASAVYMSANPVQHQWTKHIEIGIHFV
ncbi:ribonuclease H-like domain-containing protein [Tanacetum coccineum]